MNNENTFLGLIAGGAIGVVLGILFAPDKGTATRKKLLDEASLAKQKLAETANELKDKLESESSFKKETLEGQLDSILTNASFKADDIIVSLEKKLAVLKERNKLFQEEAAKNKTINEEPAS